MTEQQQVHLTSAGPSDGAKTADRELLELAAFAANERHVGLDDEGCGWNPLVNDGQALRLAVKLNMSVSMGPVRVQACTIDGALRGEFFQESRIDMDPATATRLVIVRAAAEIGAAQ